MTTHTPTWIIAGTDTDVGKTTAAAMLMLGLGAHYWKPIQTGTRDGYDRLAVQAITELPDTCFFQETYAFPEPLSPNQAAETAHTTIDPKQLMIVPKSTRPLLIECAGGLMVPITSDILQIDVIQRWAYPVVLCARTTLGTINHTLLSVEILKQRNIPIAGILLIGDDHPNNQRDILHYAEVPYLGRLPYLTALTPENLRSAYNNISPHPALRATLSQKERDISF